jgi:hypothetical protein
MKSWDMLRNAALLARLSGFTQRLSAKAYRFYR